MPGYFPDTITSMSTPNASTLWSTCPSRSTRPGWKRTSSAPSRSCPSAEWAKASASGPTLDYTNPANAAKIYDYLSRAVQVGEHLRDQPAVADRVRAVQAELLQRHHRRVHHGAEHQLQRAARRPPCPTSSACRSPRTRPSSTPSRPGRSTSAVVPPEDAPQLPSLKGLGYNYFGLPDFGNYFVAYNFQDKTGDFNNIVAQLYFRQAMQHLEDQQGQIKAYFNGAGDPAYGPIPAYPKSPFLPANAATNPYPFSVAQRDDMLKAQRLERRRRTAPTPARSRGRAPASAGPASRPAPSWPST